MSNQTPQEMEAALLLTKNNLTEHFPQRHLTAQLPRQMLNEET